MGRTRLIIYTDSRKKSDVNTFKNAAITLSKTYKAKYAKDGDDIKIVFVKDGKEIVKAINSVSRGNLLSLDIVSHGNQGGIHISRNLSPAEKAGYVKKNLHFQIRKNSDSPQSEADAELMEESMHGLYSDSMSKIGVSFYYNQKTSHSPNIATLDEIDFNVFSEKSVVEFHGCRTAEVLPVLNTWLKDNFAQKISNLLGKKSIVIGHITNTAPDKNPNGNINDYRYGRVRVYENGKLLKDSVERTKLRFPNSSTP